MGQAVAREDRQLLPTDQRVHPVDDGDPRLDKVARIQARRRVDGHAVDVEFQVAPLGRTAVDGFAQA